MFPERFVSDLRRNRHPFARIERSAPQARSLVEPGRTSYNRAVSTTTATTQFLPRSQPRTRASLARATRFLPLVVICLWLAMGVPSDGYLGRARINMILRQAIDDHGFQLAAWEREALSEKARGLVTRPGSELSPLAQHDLVVAYFDAIQEINRLENKIERIYADPKESQPPGAAAPLQAQLDALRQEQARRRPSVERILESQVAAVVEDEGLTTAGLVWPPVSFKFAESPNYLVVSPRNRIVVDKGLYLDPTLPVSKMEQIETQVEDRLDVSALVEGTGGFSSYPTMVIESSWMDWVLGTIAHEWTHTYLVFRPLGWRYFDSGAMRTINETVASIVGEEIGRQVLERYYPEKAPPADWPKPRSMGPEETRAPEFSFGTFMRETRLAVDKMLANGRLQEAETYMEARRKELAAHGYLLRRLNQAYFAFHGSYAVGPSATDPIGGKLRLLRHQTGSLLEFMRIVGGLKTAADLDAALE
jgi:hypothetical protein